MRYGDLFYFIQDILYFKVYLMSCYLSYCPPSCPLRDLPVVLASSNQRFVIRRRLICKAGTGERLLELRSRLFRPHRKTNFFGLRFPFTQWYMTRQQPSNCSSK